MLSIARFLLTLGVVLLIVGGLLYLAARFLPAGRLPLGRLPGDFQFQAGNATCVIALGTSILLSILLTVILNIVVRLLNK